jgi:hypothetical protein
MGAERPIRDIALVKNRQTVLVLHREWTDAILVRFDLKSEVKRLLEEPEGEL